MAAKKKNSHPAPLPENPTYPGVQGNMLPPELTICAQRTNTGVEFFCDALTPTDAEVADCLVYYYEEDDRPPHVSLWELKLIVPMMFSKEFPVDLVRNKRYHFAVRAVDTSGRYGPFSERLTIDG